MINEYDINDYGWINDGINKWINNEWWWINEWMNEYE